MRILDQIAQLTLRIVVSLEKGTSIGTGFLYSIHNNEEAGTFVPLLITNKHVVEGGHSAQILVTTSDSSGAEVHQNVDLPNLDQLWKPHPIGDLDLAAIPVWPLIQQLKDMGLNTRIKMLDKSVLPTKEQAEQFSFVEDILMVGYPNGLWDEANNYPLFRKGITASHPGKNFRHRPEFVVDVAAFPGSSGSPIFIFNEGSYATPNGLSIGSRVIFLGILYAGPQYTADGEIVVQTVPTQNIPLAKTSIPMNLGYAICAQAVEGFEQVFSADGRLNQQ